MLLRFHLDPETDERHIHRHGVTEEEVEEVMSRPADDFPARGGACIALGQTAAGRGRAAGRPGWGEVGSQR